MLIAFGSMTAAVFPEGMDSVSGATPLSDLANDKAVDLMDLFLGKCGGALGETCALALLIGGIYLIVRKVITWHIPVAFIGTTFLSHWHLKVAMLKQHSLGCFQVDL